MKICAFHFVAAITFSFLVFAGRVFQARAERPNLLFIAIDDLNDWVGCLQGHPQVETPHIDELAARGVLFTEAHCPAPVCGPSRAAIMSGLRAWTTGVYSNDANYPAHLPDTLSMPEDLRRNGYFVMGTGKLFHGDHKFPRDSFDLYSPAFAPPWPKQAILSSNQQPVYRWQVNGKEILFPRNGMPADRTWKDTHTFDWGPLDLPDDAFQDSLSVGWAIDRLGEQLREPFFLGVGFHLPHQPLYAPKRFHDRYPLDTIVLPETIPNDLDDLSQAGRDYALIPTTSGTHASVVRHGQWEHAVSSYLATVTFVDHLLGQLFQTLDQSRYGKNTWVLLWSDHGWHLGEKEHWGKATGWYRATRVPLILVPPKSLSTDANEGGEIQRGVRCDSPVNLIDLYPTIAEIAGLPPREELAGQSLLPLVRDPQRPWQEHTITTFGRGNHAVSTQRWRYIQYFDGTAELYDRESDPHEWHNLISKPEYGEIAERLAALVPEEPQFQHFIRYQHFKAVVPADGSPMLLFNHAVKNHLEERDDESPKHPDVVALIKRWLADQPKTAKRLIMAD